MTKTWSEERVLNTIKSILSDVIAKGARHLLDDGAWLPPCKKGCTRVVSCDSFQEGNDFIISRLSPVKSAGHRAIIQNLSDLAAMGAKPVGFVWSLEVPRPWLKNNAALLRGFCEGAAKTCKAKKLEFYGGDLSFSESRFACTITIFGDVKGKPLGRQGAKPGNILCVSRGVGASARGLALLLGSVSNPPAPFFKGGKGKKAMEAHLYPDDEGKLGQKLVGLASACMDISDGLSRDLHRLCRASKVGAIIDHLDAAIDQTITALPQAQQYALSSGEEYALLFTVPPKSWQKLNAKLKDRNIIQIGKITARKSKKPETAEIYLCQGQTLIPLPETGYDHFISHESGGHMK